MQHHFGRLIDDKKVIPAFITVPQRIEEMTGIVLTRDHITLALQVMNLKYGDSLLNGAFQPGLIGVKPSGFISQRPP